jgi:NAD(P)-dependent dehydrogenase (short-subunit alcohol dehydrogenase family)
MQFENTTVVVCGGASGLGLATIQRAHAAGANVLLIDLARSAGAEIASSLGERAQFASADVTDVQTVADAFDAIRFDTPVRAVVHTAGRGGPLRVLTKAGEPGDVAGFEDVLRLNVLGTFNVLSHGAARIAREEPTEDDERGAIVLTSSVAAFEGQIGQLPYASSKAAIVGMTICAARDLASRRIRVCTIAPGIFDTPLMHTVPERIRTALGESIPNPQRMGRPGEFAALAMHILENPYLNGATVRLDGAIRMGPA